MTLSYITKQASAFEKQLTKIKKKADTDFKWYPYNTLNNLLTIEKLLNKEKLGSFFDNLQKDNKLLDIGCADGDIAFFFEQIGFDVDVIDRAETNFNDLKGCHYLKDYFNSKITILNQDIDRNISLSEDYSLTFALGILYHLRNPFYFLNMLCLHSEYVFISTRIASHAPDGTCIRDIPVSYLVGKEELNNDPTNYWIFSLSGMRRLIDRSGFHIAGELQVGRTDYSTPHKVEEDERYFALLKRKDNYKDIFTHHHF